MEAVNQGTLRLVSGTCPLEEILTSKTPGDYIVHILECTNCPGRFKFGVDTYHGSGGAGGGHIAITSKDVVVCPLISREQQKRVDELCKMVLPEMADSKKNTTK